MSDDITETEKFMELRSRLAIGTGLVASLLGGIGGAVPPSNTRLSNDVGRGYVSVYTLATGLPYSDTVLDECGISRGRQNEPAVAVNPRNARVIVGSSNDYCGVYQNGAPVGPIWLGYYRSENQGVSFVSSLVPGYPGDTSPYAASARIRTASSGDPVLAWDNHGRLYAGSESSDDPAGSKKGFGDVWVATFDNPGGQSGNTLDDGKRFVRSVIVEKGASAPNLGGKFNDKTAIQADRTGGACDGNVYFAWSRFTGARASNIYFSRSLDHGATWSPPANLTPKLHGVQFPSVAVTGNGQLFITVVGDGDKVYYVRSDNCGRNFDPIRTVASFIPYNAQDVNAAQPAPPQSALDDPLFEDAAMAGGPARDCGDFENACQSGYTFFRRDTSAVAAADQTDAVNSYVYVAYDSTKPGTQVSTGTSYGSVAPGVGSQSAIFVVRLDGATGQVTAPVAVDSQTVGHQTFPALAAESGLVHLIWYDSRLDPAYSPTRPIGNYADGLTSASLDVYGTVSANFGVNWTAGSRLTNFTSNPNYEQFSGRTVPFAGDYLSVSAVGNFAFATWTDWRNTVAGADPREGPGGSDDADVKQCRTFDTVTATWSGDTCPHEGGLDQNIYGAAAP